MTIPVVCGYGINRIKVSGLWTIKVDNSKMITGEFKQNENTFPISGSVKTDGTFTASANIRAVKGTIIKISGKIDKESGAIFGTIEKDSKKSTLYGYKQTENVEAVNENIFLVWELKLVEIKGGSLKMNFPMEIPIDKIEIVNMRVYFLFMEKNELYQAVKISGVPDPSHIPNLSDGLFKAKINYSSSGKQIAVFSELNGNKMIMVGEFNINKNNLIIDGVMNRSSNGEEETVKSKWTLEKVSEPTVDKIKNAPDVPVIQP